MMWQLSDEWAIGLDPYNWMLQKHSGNRWRSVSFYPTPELLLQSLHRKTLRTMPPEPDLVRHLEAAYKRGEELSEAFSEQLHTRLGDLAKLTPQPACTMLGINRA